MGQDYLQEIITAAVSLTRLRLVCYDTDFALDKKKCRIKIFYGV